MKVGYVRVSTLEQNPARQIEIMKSFGVEKTYTDKTSGKVDTTTPQGRFVLAVFAVLSEMERENILERQHEGIGIAKTEGK